MSLGTALIRSQRLKREKKYSNQGAGHAGNYQMKHEQTDINEFLDSKKYLEEAEDDEEDVLAASFPTEELYFRFSVMADDVREKLHADASRSSNPVYLTIPKRPNWDFSDDKETLLTRESQCFTEWKKSIRGLEKNTSPVLCPYEKNIELWRQLWRVIERCDVIFQILDCRNPNVYRSFDLEEYISSKNKMLIFILNKADLICEKQRLIWTEYFQRKKVNFLFFASETDSRVLCRLSAEQKNADSVAQSKKEKSRKSTRLRGMVNTSLAGNKDMCSFLSKDSIESVKSAVSENDSSISFKDLLPLDKRNIWSSVQKVLVKKHTSLNSSEVWSIEEVRTLMESFRCIKEQLQQLLHGESLSASIEPEQPDDAHLSKDTKPKVNVKIGLIGFPNVGKSSFLNSLMNQKKAATSARPGRTKYFQSLVLPNNSSVILHDSPGILFPSLSKNTGTALCEGKICIEAAKNHEKHLIDVCKHVSFQTLEEKYKITLPECKISRAEEYVDVLLTTYACSRGYLGTFNLPLKSVVALKLMQDYVKGSLVFAMPPPLEQSDHDKLLSLVKSVQTLNRRSRFDKVMNALERHFESRKIPNRGIKSSAKDFFIPIEASPIEEQVYLYYELYFNLWMDE